MTLNFFWLNFFSSRELPLHPSQLGSGWTVLVRVTTTAQGTSGGVMVSKVD